jgi:ubiquinone/menaquinone biosynthesis C-methylase UbiE
MFFGFVTIGRSYHPGMGWFRKAAERDALAVTMAGVKLGDRFLAIGVRDAKLVAALGTKAGLTGRACAIDADAGRAATGAADVHGEGALVEVEQAAWDALPYNDGSFDVAVARDVLAALDAHPRRRVLRGGGRLLVIESTRRTRVDAAALTTALTNAGFAAVRVLAEANHTIFVEGIKKA